MLTVSQNDAVTLSYTGKLDNGTVFISASEKQPQTIIIGNHDVPPSVEQALLGLTVGQQIKVRVEPDEGYGPRRKDLLQTLPKKHFGNKIAPKVGMILSLKVDRDGVETQVPATIVEVKGESVTVDYNHPLAGHNLTYELSVLSIDRPN